MYEIISSDLIIKNKLTMRQIMDFHQEMINYEGNIYLLCKHKVVDATKLSKLVSFMLTVEEDSKLKVVIEGQNVQSILDKVTRCCNPASKEERHNYKFYINPTETVQI